MDRLFLDANVLFSAACRADSGLRRLWRLKNAELCTSRYAMEEARFNLAHEAQLRRLAGLAKGMTFLEAGRRALPAGVSLPEKDVPILLAALEARATHLITGDIQHFGPYFDEAIEGILVLTPSEYLKTAAR